MKYSAFTLVGINEDIAAFRLDSNALKGKKIELATEAAVFDFANITDWTGLVRYLLRYGLQPILNAHRLYYQHSSEIALKYESLLEGNLKFDVFMNDKDKDFKNVMRWTADHQSKLLENDNCFGVHIRDIVAASRCIKMILSLLAIHYSDESVFPNFLAERILIREWGDTHNDFFDIKNPPKSLRLVKICITDVLGLLAPHEISKEKFKADSDKACAIETMTVEQKNYPVKHVKVLYEHPPFYGTYFTFAKMPANLKKYESESQAKIESFKRCSMTIVKDIFSAMNKDLPNPATSLFGSEAVPASLRAFPESMTKIANSKSVALCKFPECHQPIYTGRSKKNKREYCNANHGYLYRKWKREQAKQSQANSE